MRLFKSPPQASLPPPSNNSSSLLEIDDLLSALPEQERSEHFLMSHLLAAGFRGGIYQLLVLQFQLATLLEAGRHFEATFEQDQYGNLDDIGIVVKDSNNNVLQVKNYQVKYYNNPISIDDFYQRTTPQNNNSNKKKSKKEKKMHIGKFFYGWLRCHSDFPNVSDERITCILYSNTSLDAIITRAVSPNGTFSKAFYGNHITLPRKRGVTAKVPQSFLTHSNISTHFSKKTWEALINLNLLDQEGYFTQHYHIGIQSLSLSYTVIPTNFKAQKQQYENLVLELLKKRYQDHEANQSNLHTIFYEEAWKYLQRNGLHPSQQAKGNMEKQSLFYRFLQSFRFQIHQAAIASLIPKILEKLSRIIGKLATHEQEATEQVFLCLYYAIQAWFIKEREDKKIVPKLTNAIMRKLIQESLIKSKYAHELRGYSKAVFQNLPCGTCDRYIKPNEEAALKQTLAQPGVVQVHGQKGIGKSTMVRKLLVSDYPQQYLTFGVKDLVDSPDLRKKLIEVIKAIPSLKIILIDAAESALNLSQPGKNIFFDLVDNLKGIGCVVVLTIAAEAASHSVFQIDSRRLSIQPLDLKCVIDTYPALERYQTIQPLMRLVRIPFYLTAIIRLLNQKHTEGFNKLPLQDEVNLEARLIEVILEGNDKTQIEERRSILRTMALAQLDPVLMSQGTVLEDSKTLRTLLKDEVIVSREGKYYFSHDLFFEHAVISIWQRQLQNYKEKKKLNKFWGKFETYFKTNTTVFILKKWLALYPEQLTKEIIKCLPDLSSFQVFRYIQSLSITLHNDVLFDELLKKKYIKLDSIFYDIHTNHVITPILFAIKNHYSRGLQILLDSNFSPHHPDAGYFTADSRTQSASYQITPTNDPSLETSEDSQSSNESSEYSTNDNNNDDDDKNASTTEYDSGDDYSLIMNSEGNFVYPSDYSEDEGYFPSDTDDDDSSIIDFTRSPYKYWSSGFDEVSGFTDDDGEWIENERYHNPPDKTLYYLHQAAAGHHTECVEILLESYTQRGEAYAVNLCNEYQETPLHHAALNDATNTVALLLAKGAFANLYDAWYETPLHNAAYGNAVASAKLLLQSGANPNVFNQHELSPIHIAIAQLNIEMTALLLSYGANLTSTLFNLEDMSVADLLDEVSQRKIYPETVLDDFIIELIKLLNYGYNNDDFTWGILCETTDSALKDAQAKFVSDLMTLIEHRAQLSEYFPEFDYIDEETELEYAIKNGDVERIHSLSDFILDDIDRITDVLDDDNFDGLKETFIEGWFEIANENQYRNLKKYCEKDDSSDLSDIIARTNNLSLNKPGKPTTHILERSPIQYQSQRLFASSVDTNDFSNTQANAVLNFLGEANGDSLELEQNVHITRGEVDHSITDLNNFYTADWINLLMFCDLAHESVQHYPAIPIIQLESLTNNIANQNNRLLLIPLNVAFNKNPPGNNNHWVAVIIDKDQDQIFYLDPATQTQAPEELILLNTTLGYHHPIALNPINFQQSEQQEAWVRHCGVYVIEIFKVFLRHHAQNIKIKNTPSEEHDQVISLVTALSAIPSGEAEKAHALRKKHIESAYIFFHKQPNVFAPHTRND